MHPRIAPIGHRKFKYLDFKIMSKVGSTWSMMLSIVTVKKKWLRLIVVCLTVFGGTNAYGQRSSLLTYTGDRGEVRQVRDAKQWTLRRQNILEGMQQAMGPLPETKN